MIMKTVADSTTGAASAWEGLQGADKSSQVQKRNSKFKEDLEKIHNKRKILSQKFSFLGEVPQFAKFFTKDIR